MLHEATTFETPSDRLKQMSNSPWKTLQRLMFLPSDRNEHFCFNLSDGVSKVVAS
jgi:hypothetical protein